MLFQVTRQFMQENQEIPLKKFITRKLYLNEKIY